MATEAAPPGGQQGIGGELQVLLMLHLTLILPVFFCPENVLCFLRLLHIFKCTSD